MIRGVHTMFYSSAAEETRAFIRDVLGFKATDVGEGWLIFDVPEADMGCHPACDADGGRVGSHAISFYCDDIKQTVSQLREKGVEFCCEIVDEGFGLVTFFKMPGGIDVQLYQPKYEKHFD